MIGSPTNYLEQTQNLGFNMATEYSSLVFVVPTSRVIEINFEDRTTDITFEDRTTCIGREG